MVLDKQKFRSKYRLTSHVNLFESPYHLFQIEIECDFWAHQIV